MKYVAGECFIAGESTCNLTTAVYGNVMNSTGSIIPLIWEYIKSGKTLPLYSDEMTRFLMDVDDAIDLILKALKYRGCNVIPSLKSFKIEDLVHIFRMAEKIHEIMASSEEIRRMRYSEKDKVFLLYPNKEGDGIVFENDEYSSRDVCMTYDELYDYLKSKNYFKP